MSLIRRWECDTCARKLLPGDSKPRRAYHHWRGERCDGAWVEVEYVPASQLAEAVEALEQIVVNLDGENVDGNIFPAAALRIAREALVPSEGTDNAR